MSLAKILYNFKKDYEKAFFSLVLDSCNVIANKDIPTACIGFDKDLNVKIQINLDFFDTLTEKERNAVIEHELMHFLSGHLARFGTNKKIDNICMDFAINQQISFLPSDCINSEKFQEITNRNLTSDDRNKNFEYYYKFFDKDSETEKQIDFDEHKNDDDVTATEKELIEVCQTKIEEIIKTATEKSISVPKEVEKLITESKKINWQRLLKNFITKELNTTSSTWLKKNKYHGFYAKAVTTVKDYKINFFIDTSGSISEETVNDFSLLCKTLDSKYNKNLMFYYFNTSIYKKSKTFEYKNLQSGGTCLKDVEKIINSNNDVNIILTDGYFSEVEHKKACYLLFNGTRSNINNKHIIIDIK
jgi:predicted metal-dependent peptidase